MNTSIITIGDEILIGQIVDTNSAWMAQSLNAVGAHVVKIITSSDGHEDIIKSIKEAIEISDVVLITGGLGPTKDDITKKAIADYLNVEMVFSDSTYDWIKKLTKRWGILITENLKEQCYMPADAQLLHNAMGSAPGMWFEVEGKIIVSMPGVPYEMKYLMKEEVLPALVKEFSMTPIVHSTILTAGIGESQLAEKVKHIEENLPSSIKLAYLPGLAQVRLRLSGTGADENKLKTLINQKKEELVKLIPEYVFGYGKQTLPEVVLQLCKEKGLTLSTAESCTGGYLAHLLTAIPGASASFEGSIISYSNAIKMKQLKVKPETLEKYGAVSEACVLEMAKGACTALNTDISISISGIAGPDGGTAEKPVGTVWICISNGEENFTKKLELTKDRLKNIQYSAYIALTAVRRFVLKNYK